MSWVMSGQSSTSKAKSTIHGSKHMLCIWWDQRGVIYYELLKPNETITGKLYWKQLMRLTRALKEKRPEYGDRHDKIILLLDDARPHVAKPVKSYLDYYLFRSMSHGLSETHFFSYEECRKWLNSWIASKDESFFQRGIRMLPEKW